MGGAVGWSQAEQGTLGSPVAPPDCDKNKMLCDQEMMGLLPGKTRDVGKAASTDRLTVAGSV